MASGAPPPDEGTGLAAGESWSTPPPPEVLHLTLTSLGEGETLHRVHLDRYRPDAFNPGLAGNARFSPIRDDAGNPVPTLYAGTTMACALMETVFPPERWSPTRIRATWPTTRRPTTPCWTSPTGSE